MCADVANKSETSADESQFDSLQSITTGAALSIIGKIFSKGVGFLFNALLTRTLGASAYGLYAYGDTLITTLLLVSNFGSDKSVLRYLPQYQEDSERRRQVLGMSYLTSLAGSVGLAVVLFAAAPLINDVTFNDGRFTLVVRLFAVLLPLKTLLKLTSNAFRGVELLHYKVVVNDLLNPLARVGAVGVVLLLGYSLIGVVSALAIGVAVVLAIAIVFLVSSIGLRPSFSRDQVNLREYYYYTLPLSVQGIGVLFYQRADVFMVGYFLDDSAVGVYTIAMLLSTLTLFPLNGFNQLAPSVISRLYGANKHEELQRVYETITRWTFSASLLIAIGTVSYRAELLSVFGPAFTVGQGVLILFVIGQLVSASVGPSGNLLMMTNHQYLTSANVIVGGAANIVLNYYFIQQFGLIGAALATATGLGVLNSVLLVEVWYFEGLYPYSASFIKPMLAGIAAAAVMAGFSAIFSDLVLLFAGGAAGSVMFVVVLIGLGIEDEERKFVERIIRSRL